MGIVISLVVKIIIPWRILTVFCYHDLIGHLQALPQVGKLYATLNKDDKLFDEVDKESNEYEHVS